MSEKEKPLENFEAPDGEQANVDSLQAADKDAADEARRAAVMRVPVNVRCVVGSTKLPVAQVLQFNRGSVIEMDKRIGDPVDIMVNDRLVARGDLVVVDDNRLGVTLTEIVKDPALLE